MTTRLSAGLVFAVLWLQGPVASTTLSIQQSDPAAIRRSLAEADTLLAQRERESLDRLLPEYRRLSAAANAAGLADVAAAAELGAGRAAAWRARVNDAVVDFRKASAAYELIGPRGLLAVALAEQGSAEARAGQPKVGLQLMVRAVEVARQSGDKRALGVALDALGWSAQFGLGGEEARRALEESIAVNREVGDTRLLVSSLCGLGYRIAIEKGAPEALPMYEQALALARQSGDAWSQAFPLGFLAYAHAGNRGLEEYAEAIALTRRSGDDGQLGQHYNGVGTILYGLSRYRAALAAWQECLAIQKQIDDRRNIGATLNNIGVALISLGRRAESFRYLQEALELHRALGNEWEEAPTTASLSYAVAGTGDFPRALSLAERGRQLAMKTGHAEAEAGANTSVAGALVGLGRYREAVSAYEAALDNYRRRGVVFREAASERNIAQTWSLLGDSPKALEHYDRAIDLAEKAGNLTVLAMSLSQSAMLREEAGMPRAVVDAALDRALELARKTQAPVSIARVLSQQGTVALHRGDSRSAIRVYSETLSILRTTGDTGRTAAVVTQLGLAELQRNNRRAALRYFNQALTEGASSADPAVEAVALASLMNYWKQERRLDVAALFGKQAVEIHQRVRADLAQMDSAAQRTYLASRANVYRDLADVLIAAGRLPEAQAVIDLLKQEEFLDFVRRSATGTAYQADLTQAEAGWAARYSQIRDQVMALGQERRELLQIRERTQAEEERLKVLQADVEVANQAFNAHLEALITNAEAGRKEAIALKVQAAEDAQGLTRDLREIDDGSVLVYVLVMPEHLQLVMFSAGARKATKVEIDEQDLNRRVQAFRRAIQNPLLDPRPAGHELYRLLVGPIARDLDQAKARSIVWVLDGALRYVPMAALWDGKHYLAESHRSVIVTPAGKNRLTDLASAAWVGLGAGVSRSVGGFDGLPFVSEELRSIFKAPGSAAEGFVPGNVLLDDAFTNASFRSALRARAPVVHIASHFRFQPGNDENSFLLLGDGTRLTLAEVGRQTELFEDVDLLTLSACETAIGDVGANGVEVESLGVIAERQGAKAVIAGLWSVADESTRVLMETFYRGKVEQKLNKAEALRQAQLAMITGRSMPSAGPANGARWPHAGRQRWRQTVRRASQRALVASVLLGAVHIDGQLAMSVGAAMKR